MARPSPPVDLAGSGGTLLVAWTAIALGIALHRGQYLLVVLVLELLGLALLLVGVCRRGGAGIPLRAGLTVAVGTVAVSGIAFFPAQYSSPGPLLTLSQVLSGLMGVAVGATAVPAVRAGRIRRRLPDLALGLAVAAGATRIGATPRPRIDVHRLLQDSTIGLVHGLDMYRQCWPGSTGLKCTYPYLPITSVLLVPARVLAGDVRYGELAALGLAVLLLRRRLPAELAVLPLLLIAFPQAPYSLLQAWTEPLLVLALVTMVVAVRRGHPGWATIAFAIGLASKQHLVLLLPLAAWWPAFGWRRTLRSVGLAVLLVLPWLLAGPSAFWRDAVVHNLADPVLADALDVDALLIHLGLVPGFWFTAVALLAGYVLALRRLPRTGAGFAAAGALVDLTLDLTNKQSFFNHYTLAMALLVVAVVEAARAPLTSAASGGRVSGYRTEQVPLVDR